MFLCIRGFATMGVNTYATSTFYFFTYKSANNIEGVFNESIIFLFFFFTKNLALYAILSISVTDCNTTKYGKVPGVNTFASVNTHILHLNADKLTQFLY